MDSPAPPTGSDDGGRAFSLVEEGGVVVLRWAPGVHITGPLATEAMTAVDTLNERAKRPLVVDMTGTGRLARSARAAFAADCQVSRMAIVGSSPVDKVIANFGLQVGAIAIPARYFTSFSEAVGWLHAHEAAPGAS